MHVGSTKASVIFLGTLVGFFRRILPPFCLYGLEFALAESILTVLGPALLAGDHQKVEPGSREPPKNPGVGAQFGLAYSPQLAQVQFVLGFYVCNNNQPRSSHSFLLGTTCTAGPCVLLSCVSSVHGQF